MRRWTKSCLTRSPYWILAWSWHETNTRHLLYIVSLRWRMSPAMVPTSIVIQKGLCIYPSSSKSSYGEESRCSLKLGSLVYTYKRWGRFLHLVHTYIKGEGMYQYWIHRMWLGHRHEGPATCTYLGRRIIKSCFLLQQEKKCVIAKAQLQQSHNQVITRLLPTMRISNISSLFCPCLPRLEIVHFQESYRRPV